MIPKDLVNLIEKQSERTTSIDKKSAACALEKLGIPLDSEFGEIFLNYLPANFQSSVSDEYICDISEPTEQISVGTEFIHEMWELPENYICFTSLQGEGGYLLDKNSGGVWDFDLAQYDDFVSGLTPPRWTGFFDFIK